jgi:hypothetical protein
MDEIVTRVHKPFWLHWSQIPYTVGKAFGLADLLLPYNESISFEVGYDTRKNLLDVVMDFSDFSYLLAPYVTSSFLLM